MSVAQILTTVGIYVQTPLGRTHVAAVLVMFLVPIVAPALV